MKNLWVTTGNSFASWVADLSPLLDDARALLNWIRTLLEAGEDLAVYRVTCAPLARYRLGEHGLLVDHLERSFVAEGTVDLGYFGDSLATEIDGERLTIVALMAFAGPGGVVMTQPVEELDVLLREFRPEAAESEYGAWCPPIEINGPLVSFRDAQLSKWVSGRDTARVRISLGSDIWFPWVHGFLEEERGRGRLYDNRPLASFHTPRFNAFLDAVRRATISAGGKWELDLGRCRSPVPGVLSEFGIELDDTKLVRHWMRLAP
jgi:hypothetical protein